MWLNYNLTGIVNVGGFSNLPMSVVFALFFIVTSPYKTRLLLGGATCPERREGDVEIIYEQKNIGRNTLILIDLHPSGNNLFGPVL